MPPHTDIAILGAGPAGVATACALRRLGYEVAMIGTGFGVTLEGMSERTLAQLRGCGLDAAAECVPAPGARAGAWGGVALSGGVEYVVDRAELDRALLKDAAAARVVMRASRAMGFERSGKAWKVRTAEGALECRMLIDARGRRAQRKRAAEGPPLIAVSQRLRMSATGAPWTRIHAFRQGWSWAAVNGRGSGCFQVITLPSEPSLRAGLESHLRQLAGESREALEMLRDASPDGKPTARAATAALAAHPERPGLLTVGDSSIAVDPLCGHGMYEALRSAAVAAAAANSFLASGDWRPVGRFVLERAEEIWDRSCEAAAFHYRRQAEATPLPFWPRVACAYEAARRTEARELPGSDPTASPARIEPRPVLNGSRIELRPVVISPRAPRGVWKVDGVELAVLLDFFRGARTMDVVRAARQLSCEPSKVARAARWLSGQGMLTTSFESATSQRVG
jgi:2-polyprenyl-6-methoxyphenol hydroxylase-like FAD-dependent oxidoreductase